MEFQPGDAITREQAQSLALSEALKGAGFVSPNPLVGCVIVDSSHCFLASGYHAKLGGDHAEMAALKKIPMNRIIHATMYVTLEPCAHQGRTPPCADLLSLLPFKNVVIGVQDPNPLVAGQGIEKLKETGIGVELDPIFGKKCEKLAEMFLWHIQKKMPFVSLKMATGMDGKMSLPSGESQWITSEESRARARELRAEHDATFIGARTLIHDNPRLDFRGTRFEGQKTNRILIWDPTNKAQDFLPKSEIMKTLGKENITILNDPQITEDTLKKIYSLGIASLLVEGGGYTISQFIQKGLFNKIYQFIAPCLMGQGQGWNEALKIQSMADRVLLEFDDVERVGHEIMIKAVVKKQ